MKKIIKSSVFFLGACLFASAVNAQSASDKPAMTPQQVAEIIEKGKANAAKSAAITNPAVSVGSDKPAMTPQQYQQLMLRGSNEIKIEPVKTEVVKVNVVPSQGEVKTVTTEPATEIKVQVPPTQAEKSLKTKQ